MLLLLLLLLHWLRQAPAWEQKSRSFLGEVVYAENTEVEANKTDARIIDK